MKKKQTPQKLNNMISYGEKSTLKLVLLIMAILIAISSLLYTNRLAEKLKKEEKKKVEILASTIERFNKIDINSDVDISLEHKIIEGNTTVPLILASETGDTIFITNNLNPRKLDNEKYMQKQLEIMRARDTIIIDIGEDYRQHMYYKDSVLLTKLKYFPYVQLGIIILFVLVAYIAFSNSRKYEQNKVWVGLTKETAHQLGTPVSSLSAWTDVLEMKSEDPKLVSELKRDVHRLEQITERFSRVGSKPVLKNMDVVPIILNAVSYFESRLSKQVTIRSSLDKDASLFAPLNEALFGWVLENLIKNAADAMKGSGQIEIEALETNGKIYIDVTDNGKGIIKSRFKTIFKPGYTTKERGWGLGLSLSKRIIEDYHKGRIFVESSEPGTGSRFRIILEIA